MASIRDYDDLAKILDDFRNWEPPSDPPIACKVCGKIPKVMCQPAAQHPVYIGDGCIGVFAGATYGWATFYWNKENKVA